MESKRLNSKFNPIFVEIRKFFVSREETLVVSHFFPDGDAIGSVIAFSGMLEQWGIPYTLAIDDACPEKYSFLDGFSSIINLKSTPLNRKFDRVVILDAGAISRIGSANDLLAPNCQILNIDHHFTGDIYGNINLVNTDAAATSEILFDLFVALDIEITKKMAMALFTGILTDTGRFRFANTSSHAMHVAAELLTKGVDPGLLTENIYYNLPVSQAGAIAKALNSLEMHLGDRVSMIGLASSDKVTDTEGFVEYAASIKDVLLAAFYCELEPNLYKVSLRSRCDVDVSAVANGFGGGGHKKASGFRFRGDLTSLKAKLIGTLEKYLDADALTHG